VLAFVTASRNDSTPSFASTTSAVVVTTMVGLPSADAGTATSGAPKNVTTRTSPTVNTRFGHEERRYQFRKQLR
jgi:hypothetical protein